MKSRTYRKENMWTRALAALGRIYKSMAFRYKQFLCFFVAMLVCQSFCWLLILSNGTNNQNVRTTVLSRYDYHLSVEGLTQAQAVRLSNAVNEANAEERFYTLRVEEEDGYTAYVTLGDASIPNGKMRELYGAFISIVMPYAGLPLSEEEGTAPYTVEPSPLYTCYEDYIRENHVLSFVIALPLAVVSILLLMFLYNIRLKDQKFMFGIYMSFGADFKKLFETAVKEMLLLSAITLVPSFLLSIGAAALIYLPHGVALHLPWAQLLLFLIFNFAIVFLSVYIPTKRLSKKTPLSLISAQDNADAVTSPRRSFRLFGKTFPRDYELYSFARFRTYYIRLVLTATLFAACFLTGICLSGIYENRHADGVEEYVIELPADIDAEEGLGDCGDIVSSLISIDGVEYAQWEVSASATSIRAFMMMQQKNGRRAGEYVVETSSVVNTEEYTKAKYEGYVDAGYASATSSFTYSLYDRQMIDLLCERYTVTGDPYTVLEQDGQIIVSESLFNREVFDFSPGDTLLLCEFAPGKVPDGLLYTDERSVLAEQLKVCGIRFRTYTVCAVVRDMPATNRFTVGVNASDYQLLTDEEALPETVSVSLARGLSFDELDLIDSEIRSTLEIYTDTGYTLTQTGQYLGAKLTEEKYSGIRTVLWSVLILFLSPLVWFFSQVLFYRKREKELWILRAFGAFDADVRGIHLWGGIILGAGATVAVLLEGLLCNYLLYAFTNYVLGALGILSGVRYTFSVSVVALILALVATAAFGFLSAYLPYFMRTERGVKKKKRSPSIKEERTDVGHERTE